LNRKISAVRFILILLVLLIISGTMFYVVSVPRYAKAQSAEGGVLDLTAGDFSRDLYSLEGEWEFYYDKLYTPEDYTGGEPEGKEFIAVPLSWHNAGYPLHGCATYRLTLLIDEPEVTMLIPEIQNSSIVWINGQRVFQAGKPDYYQSENLTGLRNAFVTAQPDDGQVEIIVQAANYGWYSSGMVHNIDTARSDILQRDALMRRALVGVTIGILLAIAFYHIILYLYNRSEIVYLVFFLFCIIASIRFSIDSNGFAALLLPGGVGYFLSILYLICLILQVMLLLIFTHLVFSLPVSKINIIIYSTCFAIPLIAIIILPYGMVSFQIALIILIPKLIALINVIRSKRLASYPLYWLYIFALGGYCLWFPLSQFVLNNIFYMHGIVTTLFLVFSQCFVLSVSYAETKRREEELSRKTDFFRRMNHNLRTPLTVVSTNIQTAQRRPDEVGELLEESQSVIMNMASIIDNALEDGKESAVGLTSADSFRSENGSDPEVEL